MIKDISRNGMPEIAYIGCRSVDVVLVLGTLSLRFYEQTNTHCTGQAGTSAGPPSTRLSRIEPWPSELTVERGRRHEQETHEDREAAKPQGTAYDPVNG